MVLAKIRKHRPPPARVLDAGCGTGTLTLMLLEAGYGVAAVDGSRMCIQRLNEGLEAAFNLDGPASVDPEKGLNLNDVSTGVAELHALPFENESFEAAVSGEVLEHLDDDRAAVEELYRVMKPGAPCVVTVPASPRLWGIEDQWAGHKRRYQKKELQQLFESAGFETIELRHWGWPVTWLYNRIFYKRWLRRQLAKGEPDPEITGSIGAHPLVMSAMYYVFSFDRLFQWIPLGIGLIGVFRKD